MSSAPAKQIYFRLRKSHLTEGLFYDIYVRPTSLQGDEKMKPIFSTEQARYQKFASFFIDALGCFAVLRESMRDAQTFGGVCRASLWGRVKNQAKN